MKRVLESDGSGSGKAPLWVKATAPFEAANALLARVRGCDWTPFYVGGKITQQDRINMLDRQIRDNKSGKRGIVSSEA